VVARWKAFPPLVALVPAARIFPQQRPPLPQWPFVAFGSPIVRGFSASCLDGSIVEFAGHAFAETDGQGGETVMGATHAGEIAQAMCDALAEPVRLEPYGCPYPAMAYPLWIRTQVIQDGTEADRFHAIISFEATVSS